MRLDVVIAKCLNISFCKTKSPETIHWKSTDTPTLRVSVDAASAHAPLCIVRLAVVLSVTSGVSFLLLYAISHL